jgi:hypothetical protein
MPNGSVKTGEKEVKTGRIVPMDRMGLGQQKAREVKDFAGL